MNVSLFATVVGIPLLVEAWDAVRVAGRSWRHALTAALAVASVVTECACAVSIGWMTVSALGLIGGLRPAAWIALVTAFAAVGTAAAWAAADPDEASDE